MRIVVDTYQQRQHSINIKMVLNCLVFLSLSINCVMIVGQCQSEVGQSWKNRARVGICMSVYVSCPCNVCPIILSVTSGVTTFPSLFLLNKVIIVVAYIWRTDQPECCFCESAHIKFPMESGGWGFPASHENRLPFHNR